MTTDPIEPESRDDEFDTVAVPHDEPLSDADVQTQVVHDDDHADPEPAVAEPVIATPVAEPFVQPAATTAASSAARPELLIGGSFLGGLIVAKLLGRRRG